jgi:hypothetical protein
MSTDVCVPLAACFWSAFSSPATASRARNGSDYFAGDRVWLCVTLLSTGYMVSRGVAKAGSSNRHSQERGDREADHSRVHG